MGGFILPHFLLSYTHYGTEKTVWILLGYSTHVSSHYWFYFWISVCDVDTDLV